MGFYTDSLKKYSKATTNTSLEARMQIAKTKRELELTTEYSRLKEQLQISLQTETPIHGVEAYSAINRFYGHESNKIRQELQQMSNLTPLEYFVKLAMKEFLSINQYSQDKLNEYNKVSKQLSKANGFFTPVKEALGLQPDSKTLFAKQDQLCFEYNVGLTAVEDWKNLFLEERLSYLTDRALLEDSYEFDAQKLDNFATINKSQQDQKETVEFEEVDLTELLKQDLTKLAQTNLTVEDIIVQE